jgi:potassium-dependent mechanosensitive channel
MRNYVVILVAMILSAFTAWGQTTLPAPTTSPSTQPTTAPATVPLAEVATQGESAFSLLRSIQADLQSDNITDSIAQELPQLTTEINSRADETSRLLLSNPSLQMLHAMERDWQAVADDLDDWNRKLIRRHAQLQSEKAQLENLQGLWTATREKAQSSKKHGDNAEIRDRIDQVLVAIGKTSKAREDRYTFLWDMQQKVDDQNARVIEIQASVQQAIDQAFSRLLTRDSPPVWEMFTAQDGQSLVQDSQLSFSAQRQALQAYLDRRRMRFLIHALAVLCIGGILLWLRRQVHRTVSDDPSATRALLVFQFPVAMAVVLSLLISGWIYPQAPRLLWALLGAVALVPTIIILRRLSDPRLYPILDVMIVFYLIDQLRSVTAALPLPSRCLFMVEMLGAIGFLLWYARRRKSADQPSKLQRRATLIARMVCAIFAAALAANIFGYVSLSNLLGDAALGSAYLGVILYATANIIDGLVIIVLRIRPLVYLKMVERHRVLLERRIATVVRWIAGVLWVIGVLQMLSVRGPLFAFVGNVLGTELMFGSMHFSLGHMLMFGLTVWAAFLFSKLLRFVLEEDVYERMSLPSGLPYAISRIIHYCVVLLGFFVAVKALGYNMTNFTILAGAFGVGLGFGMQNIVNNFVSGLILLFERPVRVGDVIQMGDTTGVVGRIGIRASIVRTPDSSEIIVPNGNLISSNVVNWTLSNRMRGIDIPVGVPSGTDPARVMQLLTRVAAEHPLIVHDPKPQAYFVKFGADSFNFELHAWTNRAEQWVQVRSDLAVAINAALVKENIGVR